MSDNPQYRLPAMEKALNTFLKFIFYYRLVFVLLAISGIAFIIHLVWIQSASADQFKNSALVLTCGSIIIGILYSIVNYEHNQLKFRHDVKLGRETQTFNTACKMYEADMITHFKNIKLLYRNNKSLFTESKFGEIDTKFKEQPDTRVSFIVIANYFEGISIGIEQGIIDEVFMKEFFKTIWRDFYNEYGTYIEYMKVEYKSQRIFWKFTSLAKKWNKEP